MKICIAKQSEKKSGEACDRKALWKFEEKSSVKGQIRIFSMTRLVALTLMIGSILPRGLSGRRLRLIPS